ncbi:flavin reductase family protein [Glaciecola sp. 1036]|uniref:flavin reductase family protein n=1 Tax=Alteromonadaceae TaxID=72275 RepID=UPI003CFEA1E1
MQKQFTRDQIDRLEQRYRANLINSLSGFKSANLIGTRNAEGNTNLCIVSSVFHVGANPPLMGMLMRPHTVVRDTLSNLKTTGEFTINHVNSNMLLQAHQTSARYESDVSEFEQTNLTQEFSQGIKAPYVAEAKIKIGLKVKSIQLIELNKTELVIGEIIELFLPSTIIADDGYLDIEAAHSICVSGLDSYHNTSRIDRLSYAKPESQPSSIWKPPKTKDFDIC